MKLASGSRLFHKMLHYQAIEAVPREFAGARVSSRERAQGRIPSVVFSQGIPNGGPRPDPRKVLVTTANREIDSLLNSIGLPFFLSTTFPLQIRAGPGSSHLIDSGNVLPVKVHKDKESGRLLNLVFVWAENGDHLKVDVPVIFKGEEGCPGINKGGVLRKIRSSIQYLCPAEHIPQKIEVDVSQLDIKDRIFMKDLEVHPSLKLLSKNDLLPVCTIAGLKSKIVPPS